MSCRFLTIMAISILLVSALISCEQQESFEYQADMSLESDKGQGKLVLLNELISSQGALINFWASWCRPCRNEMPSLVELNKYLENYKVSVLLVSIDTDRYLYEEFLRRYYAESLDARNLRTYRAVENQPQLAIPLTLIVDGKGKIIHRIEGERNWNSQEMIKMVVETLELDKESGAK